MFVSKTDDMEFLFLFFRFISFFFSHSTFFTFCYKATNGKRLAIWNKQNFFFLFLLQPQIKVLQFNQPEISVSSL